MKKLLASAFALLAVTFSAKAGDDKPITVKQLPVASQNFIKQHFADRKVALVKEETDFFVKSYEVTFADLCKIEFDSEGQWTDIECKQGYVPTSAVPAHINDYVKANYPDRKIKSIERERRGYEVDLTGNVDLKFDTAFNIIDIDAD
ncbi:MAG: PepSY-like domain-containing protein [Rikenellaceae bacterium]|nr:PepSY-like domain-containing protein [Rikenellaceae bacterium]